MLDWFSRLFDTGTQTRLAAGENLFSAGENVRSVFLIVEGQVDLVRYSKSGNRLVLCRAVSGQILAEASVYSSQYHCDGVVARASVLRAIPVRKFLDELAGNAELASDWAQMLAESLQSSRMQAEIRSLRTVAQRLDAWLLTNRHIPPKGEVQNLADALGVSREALYRELAKRL